MNENESQYLESRDIILDKKRFVKSTLLAWMIFIGIDFLFHASILEGIWKIETEAIKPLLDLALLIPIGYLSFLLFTMMIGYLFNKIFKEKPENRDVMNFTLIFGLLYSISNFLALYSYVNIPLLNLILNNIVAFLEIIGVIFVYYNTLYLEKSKKQAWILVLIFVLLMMAGIIIQNIQNF